MYYSNLHEHPHAPSLPPGHDLQQIHLGVGTQPGLVRCLVCRLHASAQVDMARPKATPATAPRPPGRPATLAPEERTAPRTIRLNDARWAKLKRLGTAWLTKAIDRAKEPTAK